MLAGAASWWRSGRRRLVIVMALCGGGYLILAPWVMAANTSVRYALPALPFLAALAAGVPASRRGIVAAMGLTGCVTVLLAMFAWAAPALAQRAVEPAPAWAGLEWVRTYCNPETTVVMYSGVMRPHAQYILRCAGFRIVRFRDVRSMKLHDATWIASVMSPLRGVHGPLAFVDVWKNPALARMSRGRYLSCGVRVDRVRPRWAALKGGLARRTFKAVPMDARTSAHARAQATARKHEHLPR